MDIADVAIEVAGFVIIAALTTGAFAIAYDRKRLVQGVCFGMGIALLVLPFVAYVAARITNHHATDMDLTPPAYIVATALTCGGLCLLGVLGGAWAEVRRRNQPDLAHAVKIGPEQDGNDDPALWVPWRKQDDPQA